MFQVNLKRLNEITVNLFFPTKISVIELQNMYFRIYSFVFIAVLFVLFLVEFYLPQKLQKIDFFGTFYQILPNSIVFLNIILLQQFHQVLPNFTKVLPFTIKLCFFCFSFCRILLAQKAIFVGQSVAKSLSSTT